MTHQRASNERLEAIQDKARALRRMTTNADLLDILDYVLAISPAVESAPGITKPRESTKAPSIESTDCPVCQARRASRSAIQGRWRAKAKASRG